MEFKQEYPVCEHREYYQDFDGSGAMASCDLLAECVVITESEDVLLCPEHARITSGPDFIRPINGQDLEEWNQGLAFALNLPLTYLEAEAILNGHWEPKPPYTNTNCWYIGYETGVVRKARKFKEEADAQA